MKDHEMNQKGNHTEKMTEEKIDCFHQWLVASDYSPGTCEKYVRDIRKCAAWLDGQALSQDRLVAYKGFLIDEALKPVTINSILSAINTYCKFAGIPERLSFLRIQKRLFRDDAKELTQQDYLRLVQTAEKNRNRRLALILEAICSTGIRVSELKFLTVDAIDQGVAQIRMKGKVREILISGKLCRKLRKYAKSEKIRSGEIFITKRGKGISRKQVWSEMKALADAAGVEQNKIFPHNLRHLFAKVFYRITRNLVKLSNILGHSSIETTRIYLQASVKEHLPDLEKTGEVLIQ